MTIRHPTRPFAPGLAPHDKGFRFALGAAEEPRSLVWRIWVRDDEVHCDARTASEEIGLTAYPTGRWRIEMGGVVSRWHRPKEFRPGWTRGPDVVLPGRVAAAEPAAPRAKAAEPLTWLRVPADGSVARIQLWFAGPGADEARWRQALPRGAEPLMVLSLRRAGTVHVVRLDEAAEAEDAPKASGVPARGVTIRADQTGRPSFWETVA